MKDIKFSVLVPVYNAEKYLDECIKSVLEQTYQNYELILVDDGSTDLSGAICDKYCAENNKVKVIHKKNQGALSARISGIKIAIGNYFVFVDADDYLEKNALERLNDVVVKYNVDGIIFNMQCFSEDGKVKLFTQPLFKQDTVIENKKDLYKLIFFSDGYNSMCRKVFNAKLFDDIDYSMLYHVAYGEDLLQSIQLLKNCKKVVVINDVLYNYRTNFNSATHTLNYSKYKVKFVVREKVLELLQEERVFSKRDYDEYREKMIELLVSEILMIARFKTSIKNRIKLYKQIEKSNYYKDFLLIQESDKIQTKRTKLIFGLFKRKRYFTILLIMQIYRTLKPFVMGR